MIIRCCIGGITIVLLLSTFSYAQWGGSGRDDFSTPGINEGRWGSGRDDFSTPFINEGRIGSGTRKPW